MRHRKRFIEKENPAEKQIKENDKNKFQLKHIIIPIELFGNEKLNSTDIYLFAFINILDGKNGCFASNAYLANLLNVSETTISTSITKLIKLKYIDKTGFDGRKRTLKINLSYLKIYKNISDEFNKKYSGKFKSRPKASLKTDLNQTSNIKSINIKSINIKTSSLSKDKDYVFSKHEEQIISIINFWNNLPNSVSHSNPDTKVYKTISLQIENLLSGHPLICKNDNQPTKPFLDFINQNHLPESLWHKTWTEVEINNIFQVINDDVPEGEKISLNQILWNAFAKRKGGGFSLFLYTASQATIPKEYFELTKTLADIVGIRLKKNQEIEWAQDFQQFAKKEEISSKQIISLLSWYKNNKDNKYTLVIDSPQELQEKYIKLLRAKARQSDNFPNQESQNLSPAGFPIITKSYDRKSKFRKTVEEWQALLEANTNKLLNADIWKTNHTPNKISVFNNVVSMQVWLDNVDFSLYGGSNLQNRINPLHKLIDYYILCIDEWWGWMNGVKDNVFDVNNKIFKMFIREMEDSFPARIEIKSNGWVNDSDWEPRD